MNIRLVSELARPLALVIVSHLPAQGTIQDGNVRWTLHAFPPPATFAPHNADFSADACTFDVLHESRWFWRRSAEPNARPLLAVGNGSFAQTWGADTVAFDWGDADSAGAIDLRQTVTVDSTGSASGICAHAVTVTNISGAPLDVELFFYVDVDHNDLFDDDRTLSGSTGDRFLVGDDEACGGCVEIRGQRATHWEVAPFFQLAQNLLAGGAAYSLADGGLPFGPADFTSALQWSLSLGVGASQTLRATISHNDLDAGGVPSNAIVSGASTPGTNGAPALVSPTLPRLGNAHTLQILNAGGQGTTTLWFGIGAGPALPFCGLTLHVPAPIAVVDVALSTSGGATFRIPHLCEPAFAGQPILTQVLSLDPGSTACLPVIASPLLTLIYGD